MVGSSTNVRAFAAMVAACAVLLAAAASASAAPLVLTSNLAGTVSTIDASTNGYVGAPIGVGGRLSSIVVTPDARFAYVADRESGSVSVVELATRRVVGEPIKVGEGSLTLALSPDGKTLYAAEFSNRRVVTIDTRTDGVTGEVLLGAGPTGIAIAPDGKTGYVIEGEAEAVQVFDTQSLMPIGVPIVLPDRPSSIAISPDGKTVYIGDGLAGLVTIDTATEHLGYIPVERTTHQVAVSPDGRTAWVGTLVDVVSVIDLQTNRVVREIKTSEEPGEIAMTPDGRFVYVVEGISQVAVFDAQTFQQVGPPISNGGVLGGIAITPDQSPTAAFTAPNATVGSPIAFSGAASTDPDGTIASWNWTFGDGATGTGIDPSHAYASPGTFGAKLSVMDNEGCGEAEVFTGRTAYCSGNVGASVTHPVTVNVPSPPPAAAPPTNSFRFGRVVHNLRNGTVRVQVTLPDAGFVLLFGKKVHAVTRKSMGPQTMWLTLHARVELAKRLKKTLRAPVKFRVTFTPNGGTPNTVHRSVTLLRKPRHEH